MKNDKNNVPGASSHPSAVAERPSLLLFLLVPVPLVVGHVYANRLRQLLELVVRVVHHPVLYILPQRIEYLLYLVVLLRTHLQVLQTVLLRQPLPLFGRYLANSILLQVYFVRDQDLLHRGGRSQVHLMDPLLYILGLGTDIFEGFPVVDGVHQYDTGRALVVGFSDGFEPLLSGGVPDLEFEPFVFDVDGFDVEVDADGGDVGVLEDIFAESGEDVGFADATVADDDEFDHVVEVVLLVVDLLQDAFVHGTLDYKIQILQQPWSLLNRLIIMSSQTLNESRFLVEEVNVDEEPTEEEIFDRAEELEIDDLLLAKESLTKELDPEWRPYRNRKKNIYYINLKERRAYVDHPIDMEYKILYAKKNNLLPPKFPSVRVEEIAKSMHLVQEEIRKFQEEENREAHLNIVYEEPSEEEESSRTKTVQASEEMEEELDTEDLEEFLRYKRLLEQQYDMRLEQYRNEQRTKIEIVESDHEKAMGRLRKRAARELEDMCEREIGRKNESDFEKQKQKIDRQFFGRRQQFIENSIKCRELQQSIERKQYRVEVLLREKRQYQKISQLQYQQQQIYLYKNQQLNQLISELKEELKEKVDRIVGGSKFYQKVLKDQLENLFPSSRLRRKSIFRKQTEQAELKVQNNVYADLENEIESEKVWTRYSPPKRREVQGKPSLNLRLWMRII